MGVKDDVSVKSFDEDSLIGWNRRSSSLVGFYLFNKSSQSIDVARPTLRKGLNRRRFRGVFIN